MLVRPEGRTLQDADILSSALFQCSSAPKDGRYRMLIGVGEVGEEVGEEII